MQIYRNVPFAFSYYRSARNGGAHRSQHIARARIQRSRPATVGAGGGGPVLRRAEHCCGTGARARIRWLDAAEVISIQKLNIVRVI